jgi:hypothetical protein
MFRKMFTNGAKWTFGVDVSPAIVHSYALETFLDIFLSLLRKCAVAWEKVTIARLERVAAKLKESATRSPNRWKWRKPPDDRAVFSNSRRGKVRRRGDHVRYAGGTAYSRPGGMCRVGFGAAVAEEPTPLGHEQPATTPKPRRPTGQEEKEGRPTPQAAK